VCIQWAKASRAERCQRAQAHLLLFKECGAGIQRIAGVASREARFGQNVVLSVSHGADKFGTAAFNAAKQAWGHAQPPAEKVFSLF
jgi:hypothetical protein